MSTEREDTDMRAADADRAAVAQRLQRAVDEGRLGLTDYDQRLQDVYAARTYAELERVTADLPAGTSLQKHGDKQAKKQAKKQAEAERKAAEQRREWIGEWRTWLGGAIIMITIWGVTSLVSGELNRFWPAIPLGIWAAVLVASAVWCDDSKDD